MQHNGIRATVTALALSGGLLAGGWAAAEVTTPSGKMLANTCSGCHGTDGISHGPTIPTIAGQPEEYFVYVMRKYHTGDAPGSVMNRVGEGYTDEEIQAMAAYYAAIDYVPAQQEYDTDLARRGAELHEQSCASCHTANGAVGEDDLPIIAGQWAPHLRYTLVDYLQFGRPFTEGKRSQFMEIAQGHSTDEILENIEALVHFYASQQDPALFE